MIYLITGVPRSGKTFLAKQTIEKRLKEFNVFSNIDTGFDTVQPLKDSFKDYPPKSLVVIDEAHNFRIFKRNYVYPVENDFHPDHKFLSIASTLNIDIIFITQKDTLLNINILCNVDDHHNCVIDFDDS